MVGFELIITKVNLILSVIPLHRLALNMATDFL